MMFSNARWLSEPQLPIYVDRAQPPTPDISPRLKLCLTSAMCIGFALWPFHHAHAQSQAPFPGWRGEDYTPPPAQPDGETSFWQGDQRPFDGSRRGTYSAPSRYDAPEPPPPAPIGYEPSYFLAPDPHHWRGLYAGAHLGGAIGDFVADGGLARGESDLSGFMTGGYIGFDLALGNVVAGVEFDATWSLDEGSETAFGTGRLTSDIDWLTSARARLGYTFGQFLVYGTAGIAYTNIDYDVSLNGVSLNEDQSQTGYVVGGGVDFELSSQFSIRVEALHYGFGDDDFQLGGTTVETDTDLTTIRAGLTYRF